MATADELYGGNWTPAELIEERDDLRRRVAEAEREAQASWRESYAARRQAKELKAELARLAIAAGK